MEVADGCVSLEKLNMAQDEKWIANWKAVMDFMEPINGGHQSSWIGREDSDIGGNTSRNFLMQEN